MQKADGAHDLPTPEYMSEMASGMDLYANVAEETVLPKGGIAIVPTGIMISLPSGYEAQIRPRSGLAAKYGIGLVNSPGTIDADYRGEIKAIMINHGQEDFHIRRGDRIAQMVICQTERASFELVGELPETRRGAGGFGHTGGAHGLE